MSSGFHGKDDLALDASELPDPGHHVVVASTVITDAEGFDDDLVVGGDDRDLMTSLGDVDSNNEHRKHHPKRITDSPQILMSHNLLQDQRRGNAPASGS